MKECLEKQIKECIKKMNEDDIYAISFWVFYAEDNPTHPVLQVGYNTESNFRRMLTEPPMWKPSGPIEARWNFAFWLQNKELTFGYDGQSKKLVENWIEEIGYRCLQDAELWGETALGDAEIDSFDSDCEHVTRGFIRTVAEIAKELQDSGFVQSVFHKKLPIIIHDLEYAAFEQCFENVAELNIEVNGSILPTEFVDFCNGAG